MTRRAQELRATLTRGTVVTVASPGVYSGKPRPAVVVQADRWLQAHPSVTLCPLTSTLVEEVPLVRIAVSPSPRNGLRKPAQLMVDKLFTVPSGGVVGWARPLMPADQPCRPERLRCRGVYLCSERPGGQARADLSRPGWPPARPAGRQGR